MSCMRLLLLGEMGHGKSSLINALRDCRAPAAPVGNSAQGVTKDVAFYPMSPEWNLELVDIPGFGCRHMSVYQIIATVEALLEPRVAGVVVTCPADSPRLNLGTHVVQALMSHGGAELWQNVILVGTKADRADEEDRSFFTQSLVPEFFRGGQPTTGQLSALASSADCSDLLRAITQLPRRATRSACELYHAPQASTMAAALAPLLGEQPETFVQLLQQARGTASMKILVLGECGDGKSTLINALRAQNVEEQAAGVHPKGVTKQVTCVEGQTLGGLAVQYLDTPGVGDMDVSPTHLCLMLEEVLKQGDVSAVIVTCPATNLHIRLGGQLVQRLAERFFVGADRWTRVILAGTKADKADEAERQNFETKIKERFFCSAIERGEPTGTAVLCSSKTGYDDLKRAILQLPPGRIRCAESDAWSVAELSSLLGVDAQALQEAQDLRRICGEVEMQKRQLQETLANLLQKEQDLKTATKLGVAEEGRLQRELKEQEQEFKHFQETQRIQAQQEAAERARHHRALQVQLDHVRQHNEQILRVQAHELEQHRQRLQQERRQFVARSLAEAQNIARQRQDESWTRRLQSGMESVFSRLPGMWI